VAIFADTWRMSQSYKCLQNSYFKQGLEWGTGSLVTGAGVSGSSPLVGSSFTMSLQEKRMVGEIGSLST
jgi:hypothetical protein